MTNEEAVSVLENVGVMTTAECIHVYQHSRLQCENFSADAVTAAYVAGLAALQEKLEAETPLTLDDLRKMDGEPVWIVFTPDPDGESLAMWALISVDKENDEIFLLNSIGGSSAYEEAWADIKAIYRRKPEEDSCR